MKLVRKSIGRVYMLFRYQADPLSAN